MRLVLLSVLASFIGCTDTSDGDDGGSDPGDPADSGDSGNETEYVAENWLWLREEVSAPGSITFTEVQYHSGSDDTIEWIELYNPMVLDIALSGWSLSGGVDFAFPDGTVLEAGGFLVVAANPERMASEAGFSEALGPYQGSLNNAGERINLHNNADRLIDTLAYGNDEPWTVLAAGTGLSLSKIAHDSASDHAENWSASQALGGTPGSGNQLDPTETVTTTELVAINATWRYDLSGDYPAEDWAAATYDDAGWSSGEAIFYAGEAEDVVVTTVWATADNYYALYLGEADGSALRQVGLDPDGDWTTTEGFEIEVGPRDLLYIAAWELSGDSGGPQMAIAEVEHEEGNIGTDAAAWEWVLGPTDGAPGPLPPEPAPTESELVTIIEENNDVGTWALPAVEATRSADPWGWALSGDFTDAANYVWADTFNSDSTTNAENTYILLRSREPLLGNAGTTEVASVPTVATFRTRFELDASPTSTELSLECVVDDGAVVYLNGTEVWRTNLPAGAISATSLAESEVETSTTLYATIDSDALVRGANVLAVELHQATRDDDDLRFGCALNARISADVYAPTVQLNEVGPAGDEGWVELGNASEGAQPVDGLVLVASSGAERVVAGGELAEGEQLLVNLDFSVESGDVVTLYSADRERVLDAIRVRTGARGRTETGGSWWFPTEASPGAPNVFAQTDDIVVNEVQYHRAPLSATGQPFAEREEEWIELYNRGEEAVDLGGWSFVDAVAFAFPAGTMLSPDDYLVVAGNADTLRAEHPQITILGDFEGSLGNGGDRIVLLDSRGNPADEVRYFDGGRWPSAADGGGSSLELRDPEADNAAGETWAASDESERSEWVSVRYRGEAEASAVGPDGVWEELVLGLLDAGELLIDDFSVVQDPDSAPVELIQNGTFEDGNRHWRLLGTHRHSEVVADPDNAANAVLRVVATGAEGHMHNHIETTLLRDISLREYEVSYRAKWISGSNQLNTRLYFNRLPVTTLIDQPSQSGTPGAPNSVAQSGFGPTFGDLQQSPVVPAAGEPVRIRVTTADPEGVQQAVLWSSVDGGEFAAQTMAENAAGVWEAQLEGQGAGTLVQFYIEAVDTRGLTTMFPAAGPDSRAIYRVDDGLAATNGLHNLRILLTPADSAWLHDDVNLMSDDAIGATVVYDEREIFYDVGVRTKGSERGRPEVVRLGYGVRFNPEQPFRGSHSSVLIDRSEGVSFGQREMLLNLVMTHAGSVSGEYNDLIQVMTPLAEHTGTAELQLDRFSDLVLSSQFEDGSDGTLFDYELIYYPLSTNDGTAEGLKLPQPDSVIGTSITDLGDDKERYRWNFMIQNNEREDDYESLIAMAQTFSLAEPDFLAEANEVIDVDQWLRAFAFATLAGVVDQYGGDGSQHNARFYLRPSDQRMLYFPHDLDFFGGTTMAVVGNPDLARLIENPAYLRMYYGHLADIVGRVYHSGHLGPWCTQLQTLLPAQNFQSHCQFIDDRADWVMYGASNAVMTVFPEVEFSITTAGGADFSVAGDEVGLEGAGWVDVATIGLDSGVLLDVEWIDQGTWRVVIPLDPGANVLDLVATDRHGAVVGNDSVTVTSGN